MATLERDEVMNGNGTVREQSEPEHWKEFAGSVRVKNIPLPSLEELEKGYIYTSQVSTKSRNGEIVTLGGNQTVIDSDYAYCQVGILLHALGFSVKDFKSKKLETFIQNCLQYYPEVYNRELAEKESAKMMQSKDKIKQQTIAALTKVARLNGQLDRLEWTEDDWESWMKANGILNV